MSGTPLPIGAPILIYVQRCLQQSGASRKYRQNAIALRPERYQQNVPAERYHTTARSVPAERTGRTLSHYGQSGTSRKLPVERYHQSVTGRALPAEPVALSAFRRGLRFTQNAINRALPPNGRARATGRALPAERYQQSATSRALQLERYQQCATRLLEQRYHHSDCMNTRAFIVFESADQ